MMHVFPRHGTRFLVVCNVDIEEGGGLVPQGERVVLCLWQSVVSDIDEASGALGSGDCFCVSIAPSPSGMVDEGISEAAGGVVMEPGPLFQIMYLG